MHRNANRKTFRKVSMGLEGNEMDIGGKESIYSVREVFVIIIITDNVEKNGGS